MLDIKFGKMELLHSYQKHNINKSRIDKSLKKIKSILNGKQGNKVIYCQDYLVVVIAKDGKFLTSYQSDKEQYFAKALKSVVGCK